MRDPVLIPLSKGQTALVLRGAVLVPLSKGQTASVLPPGDPATCTMSPWRCDHLNFLFTD